MKIINIAASAAIIACAISTSTVASAQTTDTIEAPTGFFLPSDAQRFDDPYYRYNAANGGGDWGWTHNGIAEAVATATLNISAFDVDFAQGEIDNIFAYDNGVAVLLGSLGGADETYSFTQFVLGANFFDDIAAGLQVSIAIDVTNAGAAVSLVKSSLSVNGGALPPVTPSVPEPTTWAMMIGGFALAGAAMRGRKTAVRFA